MSIEALLNIDDAVGLMQVTDDEVGTTATSDLPEEQTHTGSGADGTGVEGNKYTEAKTDGAATATSEEAPKLNADGTEIAPAGGEQTAEEQEQGSLPPIEAPAGWKTEEKEAFKSLPRDIQETLARREQDRNTELRNVQNSAAEQRKLVDAQVARLSGLADHIDGAVNREIAEMAKDFPEIRTETDVVALARSNPARFTEFQARLMQYQAVTGARDQARQELAATQQQAQQENISKAKVALEEAFPAWKDAAVARKDLTEIKDYLTTQGVPEAVSGNLIDPFAFKIIQKAIAYDKAQAQLKTTKVVNAPTAPQRPGSAPNGKQDAAKQSREAQLARLSKSGDIEDALALMRV